ncbi:MAG: glycosyltransferase family 4 protein [Polyangiaceae bacterium]
MSRIVVFGQGPMRWESSTRLFALALRTWHFANTLASQGHDVLLFAIRGHAFEGWPHEKVSHVRRGRVSVWSLSEHLAHERPELILRKMEEHAPEAVVGVNRDPAAIAVNYAGQLPFWADVNGDPMAEAQVKASALGADWNINEWYRTLMPVLLRADRFSTCSMAQRHALIGQLGMVGRLSAKNDGYEFVSAVPNSIDDEELELLGRLPRTPRAPGDRFVVLWSGGYNTWTAPDVLFDALQIAMDEAPELHFVSTGGGIAGHHEDAYERFRNAVRRSRHKKRFELAGWVQTAELPAFYAGAHAAILVDRFSYEGTLGARTRMLDWLAAGLPIVTTRLSEISHEVERAGAAITAACGDARGLADAMLELLRDPAGAARRGELGRQWAHDVCRAEPNSRRWPVGRARRVGRPTASVACVSTTARTLSLRPASKRASSGPSSREAAWAGWSKRSASSECGSSSGAERFADRLGLAEGMHAQTTPLGPDAPALEAPRLARFQWRQRLERAAPCLGLPSPCWWIAAPSPTFSTGRSPSSSSSTSRTGSSSWASWKTWATSARGFSTRRSSVSDSDAWIWCASTAPISTSTARSAQPTTCCS